MYADGTVPDGMHGAEMHKRMQPYGKRLRTQNKKRLSAKTEFSFPYCHSQYSLRMQIIPINDLHSGRTRLHICSAPVMEQSHCGCDHVMELREHFGKAARNLLLPVLYAKGEPTADRSERDRNLHEETEGPAVQPAMLWPAE